MKFTKEQLAEARKTNLYDYMLANHGDMVIKVGNSLRFASNHSVSIKYGYSGFYDFANGNSGNSIDFLVKYLDYSISDAVFALINSSNQVSSSSTTAIQQSIKAGFPRQGSNAARKVIDYLKNRGLDEPLILNLLKAGLLYQDDHSNAVFINRERTYAEIRGTQGTSFKSQRKPAGSDKFWYFNPPNSSVFPQECYICESCIDAMSLFTLLQKNAFYISIGGVGNKQAIDTIKQLPIKPILAVDNDIAGDNCRQQNADMAHIVPKFKDWNEDLIALRGND
ncbi:toprim domain-containing protein [Butyrivibrio sp. LC3010]|uniref:toprim domain-containing protein n=1 Tax=Butyrivibrio sp. LC3010 TaxID=1280680 RepID=UPI0004033F8F|nr:toprim domain-containing protein [Butyrivibrio sp. LC3010]